MGRAIAELSDKAREVFERRLKPDGPDECWPWPGSRNRSGYGEVVWREGKRLQKTRAHRLAFALANGSIPVGMHVLHRCDNPSCCNPRHLFLGTHAENMSDMAAKGRASCEPRFIGEAHPRAKLTREQVLAIWNATGTTYRIGKDLGVSPTQVRLIKQRKIWRSVTGGVAP